MTHKSCQTCRFSKAYALPDPIQAPVERTALWGLIKWVDGPDDFELSMHQYFTDRARNTLKCCRYPEPERVSKTYVCGEYQPNGDDGLELCSQGLHSWVDKSGRLPSDTTCTRCGELYGDPD